ncbi:aldehyde dehydrogenase family protein [Salinispira pacifica]|uniref:Aldehyde dehydrogenase n=1 Tax=Salinispira pacifica TaxID=1307761 RepID=V5WK56_9SPIO|nr:aldehyde dehydrogenase family protein [Salinispira pacifica]AHC16133.1 Aldehyde dehydrogenase [Salinispira pacifica]
MAHIYNPATGEVVCEQKRDDPSSLPGLVRRAADAQERWKMVPISRRRKVLDSLSRILSEDAEELAAMISRLTGKTEVDALVTEVLPSVISASYYGRSAAAALAPRPLKGSSILFFNKRSRLFREPLGVVGIISPWNYPFSIPFQEVATALMAGNGVVLKVASQCQPLGEMMKRYFTEAGLDPDLLQLTHVPGSRAGSGLIHSGIRKLFFTGSVDVGKKLAQEAGSILLPVSLELGGNDAMIVCSDANIHRAVNGAMWAGLSNCGQSCGGVERIYVHTDIYEEFRELLSRKISRLRHRTAGTENGSTDWDMGSLTTESQRKSVAVHIDDAVSKGARFVTSSLEGYGTEGFHALPGFGHPAVVLEDVDMSMKVQLDETFGPVLTLTAFSRDSEAVEHANNSYLGLTASVWTRSKSRSMYFIRELEAGAVTVNDHLMSHGMPETPWGGYKQSALGRSHSFLGFEEMTQPKVVVRDMLDFAPRQMWWYPYSANLYNGLLGAIRVIKGPRRLRFLVPLFKTFLRMFRKED